MDTLVQKYEKQDSALADKCLAEFATWYYILRKNIEKKNENEESDDTGDKILENSDSTDKKSDSEPGCFGL